MRATLWSAGSLCHVEGRQVVRGPELRTPRRQQQRLTEQPTAARLLNHCGALQLCTTTVAVHFTASQCKAGDRSALSSARLHVAVSQDAAAANTAAAGQPAAPVAAQSSSPQPPNITAVGGCPAPSLVPSSSATPPSSPSPSSAPTSTRSLSSSTSAAGS